LISEERVWVVDPVDGTQGFLRGEQYAVCLALMISGQVVVGVLGCPNLILDGQKGHLLWAQRHHGAFRVS
jgi:3'(2'), 5'-bisphosphate nucleotidase